MTHGNQRRGLKVISAIIVMIALLLLLFSHTTDLSKQSLSWVVFLPIFFLYGVVEALCSVYWLRAENLTLNQSLWAQSSLFQRPPPNTHA
jgi:hypothetical protein